MAVEVKCSSEFRADDSVPLASREPLQASPALARWITDLPAGATLTPLMIDKGNQRDPWHVMVGIRADWIEAR